MMVTENPTFTPPSLTALRCFAAAAEAGNFTRAAAELNMTQSAVSRQISKLEDGLGVRLFVRNGPYLQLTERGRAYAAAVTPPLTAILAATERFRSGLESGVVSLATLPSFGMRWLAPRLARLNRDYPELVVNCFARSDEFNFANELHDAAIHFGSPDWPGVRCDRLFGECCIPVAAPRLIEEASGAIRDVVTRVKLLTLVNRPLAWDHWSAAAGIEIENRRPSPRYELFAMLTQAAVAGVGAALIPDYLIEEELSDGRLVPLSSAPLVSEGAYYLVYPEEKLEQSALRKFRHWLLSEAETRRVGRLASFGREDGSS